MNNRILGLLTVFLLAGLAQQPSKASILEPSLEPAIPFYKTPQSPFPSGQARKSSLQQSQMGSFTDFHFKAKWGEKTLQVKNEHILRELDVTLKARSRKKSQVTLFPELNSSVVTTLSPGQSLEIESLRGIWARVRVSNLHKGYVLLTELETAEEDPGVWTSLSDVVLRKSPSANADKIVVVPKLSRLELVRLEGDYAFVRTDHKSGYAPLKDLIGRVDFAQLGWNSKKKKWETLSYRNGTRVFLSATHSNPITDYTAFRGAKNRALLSSYHPQANLGARLELLEPEAVKWSQSVIKGHGPIWWKTDLLDKEKSSNTISTADLMKRKLAGISFDSKTKRGLASANGVFKTLDGKTWTKIPFFGQEDWPVSLHPDGVWFVGPYRSTDEGVSFKPSVKWSDLVQSLQRPNGKAFMHFRVLDVQSLPKSQVLLKVDTGITVIKIKAHVLGNHWTLTK